METVKFKGQRIDNKSWAIGYHRFQQFYNRFDEPATLIWEKHFIGSLDNLKYFDGIFEQVEIDPKTLGLYSLINDIEGNEIFSGDLVTNESGQKWLVIFENGAFSCVIIGKTYPVNNHHILLRGMKGLRLVGNVHDTY